MISVNVASKATAGVAALAATIGVVGVPVANAEASAGKAEQCVTKALTPRQMEAGVVSKLKCFATCGEVVEELGYTGPDAAKVSANEFFSEPQFAALASTVLARHLDYFGTGSSITITGSACDGGGLNLSSDWVNRVDATQHVACGTIKHYDGNNYTGTMEQTQGTVNQLKFLTTIPDQVNSIKYYQ